MKDDPRDFEISILRKRVEELKRTVVDAQEAIFWHHGGEFQPSGRGGKTIFTLIDEVL